MRSNNIVESDGDVESWEQSGRKKGGNGKRRNSAARKSIRREQNRDSARRCRIRRKKQTEEIFEMLQEQKNLILQIEKKVSEMGVVLKGKDGSDSGASGEMDVDGGSHSGGQSYEEENEEFYQQEQKLSSAGNIVVPPTVPLLIKKEIGKQQEQDEDAIVMGEFGQLNSNVVVKDGQVVPPPQGQPQFDYELFDSLDLL